LGLAALEQQTRAGGGNRFGMIEQRLYDVLAAAFAAEGVDTHFTLLGDGNMHWATVLAERHRVRTIHARHEHCACEMASAYAHVTGRVGVASVTHGPGVTQIMTALTTAARGDIPLIVFAGEAPSTAAWTIQQIDQAPLVRACGVEYIQIQSVNHALDRVREAFCIAQYERRPVVIGVSDDLQRTRIHNIPRYVPSSTFIPCNPPCPPDDESVRAIAQLIASAERPIILAGRGVMLAGAKAEVLELAERSGALLATTLPARGLFDGERFSIGIGGGWSSDVATELFAKTDLVLAIGASLTGFTTHSGRLYPNAQVIQIDANPRAVRHNRAVAHIHLRADARLGVAAINKSLERSTLAKNGYKTGYKTGYRTQEIASRLKSALSIPDKLPDGTIDPRRAVQEINRVVPKDWFLVGGSGHCAYFTATNTQDRPPELYASIRHFGAIGSGLSHAIGVAVARNDRKVLLIDGDGSLIMHVQELETIARHNIQMLIVALNDGAYGSEVHKLRMDGVSDRQVRFGRPDFASIAEGFSLRGARIADLNEIEARFQDHLRGTQTEIWDIPISGDVLSTPFEREAREKQHSSLKAPA
jgi:thiamine pyrophosphate-dependent acetolactate synthase large subunit-like protein